MTSKKSHTVSVEICIVKITAASVLLVLAASSSNGLTESASFLWINY